MPDYTPIYSLPFPVAGDYVASSSENLRTAFRDQAVSTEAAINSVEGELSTAVKRQGRLADGTNLDDLWRVSDSGVHELSPAGVYTNLPPGVAGVAAQLRVESRGAVGTQEVVQYGSSRIWRRNMSNSTISPRGWLGWRRIEADAAVVDQLESDVGSAFLRRGGLPDGTALSSLTARTDTGLWIVGGSSTYPDLPEVIGTRQTAELMNFPSGSGGTFQMITFRYNQGTFWRVQTGAQGIFSDWLPLGGGSGPETAPDVLGRLELLEAATPLVTTFESTRIFTSYEAGEAYMDRLAAAHPDRASILDLGESRQGRPIRAMRMGDPAMPTFYVIASQHGDEPMGRECAYQWLREMLERPDFDTIIDGICVVVTPVVNADRINVQRLSSSGTDLNGNWPTEGTSEITAASSVLKTHDVVLTMDAHEGGLWETMQAAIANAPEVAASVKSMSQVLYDHVEQAYADAGEAFAVFPGSENLSQARNVIAERYKSATILFEGSSDLHNNMYSPDVVYREGAYMLAYRTVFEHFRANVADYVAAKAAAEGA